MVSEPPSRKTLCPEAGEEGVLPGIRTLDPCTVLVGAVQVRIFAEGITVLVKPGPE